MLGETFVHGSVANGIPVTLTAEATNATVVIETTAWRNWLPADGGGHHHRAGVHDYELVWSTTMTVGETRQGVREVARPIPINTVGTPPYADYILEVAGEELPLDDGRAVLITLSFFSIRG